MENGSSTLPSANESRGFFGTIREHAKPHDAWMLVMEWLSGEHGLLGRGRPRLGGTSPTRSRAPCAAGRRAARRHRSWRRDFLTSRQSAKRAR